MKTNIILSSKNDSSILDRQVRDCPDVSEKQFHREFPKDTKRISRDYRRLDAIVVSVIEKDFLFVVRRQRQTQEHVKVRREQ